MPLTEDQKKVRQKHFPGRRGFLPPDQMELFRQYCQEAGCPLEEGVFKRPRNSPAVKEEAPDWVPGMTIVPRQRKPKRKTDSYYGSLDSSEGGEGASYGHAAAAAAAAAAGELPHGQDRLLLEARLAANGGDHREIGLSLGEADSGSSGEDLSHKHPRLGNLPHAAHSQLNLQQLQQQQQHDLSNSPAHGLLDPAAAAALGAAHDDVVLGLLGSPLRSGQLPDSAAAAATAAAADAAATAADAAADAAGVDAVHPAARPPARLPSTHRASSFGDADDHEQQQQHELAEAGLEHEGPGNDAIKGLIDLRATHTGHPGASAPTSAAAAAASGDLDYHASLEEFEQQQQHDEQHHHQPHQQQQQYAPILTVSTGRGRGGRPRGRPPSRGRGRGRGRVKRDSEPIAVGSPLHPVQPLQYHNSAPLYHGSGGGMAAAAAAAHHHYPSAFGSLGGAGQGQSTLARLTHAAAMAEGMGTRGDRSRPDDYYQVYSEYFTAQEAYHRLLSSLAANPMLSLVPEPEVPESLYGPAYAGRVQDSANMLAAAAAIDLLSPGALSASRRKRQHSGTCHKPAAAGAFGGAAAAAAVAAGGPHAAADADADHMELDHHDHRQSAEKAPYQQQQQRQQQQQGQQLVVTQRES